MSDNIVKKYSLIFVGLLVMVLGWGLLLRPLFGGAQPSLYSLIWFVPGGVCIWLGDKIMKKGARRD